MIEKGAEILSDDKWTIEDSKSPASTSIQTSPDSTITKTPDQNQDSSQDLTSIIQEDEDNEECKISKRSKRQHIIANRLINS